MAELFSEDTLEPIAIIGTAFRFPGACTVADFWDNLVAGKEQVTRFSRKELIRRGVAASDIDNPHYVMSNVVLDNVEMFDADFFNITPREAEYTDPQQRLFLECAWDALEDAGCDPGATEALIGVYAGAGSSLYLQEVLLKNSAYLNSIGKFQITLGNEKDFLPLKVSYKLNLNGPSVNVNTSCSTSLVAVHMGCQALLTYQCDFVLAGGVSIKIPQSVGYMYQEGAILSRDGHCRAFDAEASGTIFGSGSGVVVLKRFQEAVADGDDIYAVIRGSAVNNDGAAKAGFTAPSATRQARVVAEALSLAGVSPEQIGYLETHGTGTQLGDPIEFNALKDAFAAGVGKIDCALGSIKTNIGHLDAAAGVAGLIKTTLMLKHRKLVPSLNFKTMNPKIPAGGVGFHVNTKYRDMQPIGNRYVAGVSSFGIGGTNAHIVLEAAPLRKQEAASDSAELLCFSARTEAAVGRRIRDLRDFGQRNPELRLSDLAYTLAVGRKEFNWRSFMVCRSLKELLQSADPGAGVLSQTCCVKPLEDPQLVFVLHRELQEAGPDCYEPLGLYRREHEDLKKRLQLAASEYAEPLIRNFIDGYARLAVWMSWGVKPCYLLPTSYLQELSAACLAGVLTPEEAGRFLKATVSAANPSGPSAGNTLDDLEFRQAAVPYYSPASETWITAGECPEHGYRHKLAALLKAKAEREVVFSYAHIPSPLFFAVFQCRLPAKPESLFDAAETAGTGGTGEILDAVGTLWSRGIVIDWKQFYAGETRYKVHLPGYPFERKRYWLDNCKTDNNRDCLGAEAAEKQNPGEWLYLKNWKSRYGSAHGMAASPETSTLLIFSNAAGWEDALLERCTAEGIRTILVHKGHGYAENGEDCYTIDPGVEQSYIDLVARLQDSTGRRIRILFCWSLLPDWSPLDSHTGEYLDNSLYALFYLTRALCRQNSLAADIFLLTGNLHAVTGGESLSPLQALILSGVSVIPQEHNPLQVKNIDVELAENVSPEVLTAGIWKEIKLGTAERIVAIRNGLRWIPVYQQVTDSRPDFDAGLKENAVILMIGGLGGIGLEVAAYLSLQQKLRFVFMSRSAVNKDGNSASGKNDLTGEIRDKLMLIEEHGSEVLVLQGDVCVPEDIARVVEITESRWGAVNGIFHLAGVPGSGLMQFTSPAAMQQVLQAKLQGVLSLDAFFRDRELDFFILFSSLSSLIGGIGSYDYCAASSFLDHYSAFAAVNRKWFTCTINWDLWENTGMAKDQSFLKQAGMKHKGMVPAKGCDALLRALSLRHHQVIVSTIGLTTLLDNWKKFSLQDTLSAASGGTGQGVRKAVKVVSSSEDVKPALEAYLLGIWKEDLGVSGIDVDDDFLSLGGNSLIMINIVNKLQMCLDEIIHIEIFGSGGEACTISRQAGYLLENYTEAVQQKIVNCTGPDSGSVLPGEDARGKRLTRRDLDTLKTRLDRKQPLQHVPGLPPEAKNPPAVFVLSPPRSGSTLLRIILGGHSALFAPPEIALLNMNSIAEAAGGKEAAFLRTLMEAYNCEAETAKAKLASFISQQLSIQAVYADLQNRIRDRLLVEKTVDYALYAHRLPLCETYFHEAKYIHLLRHPCGTVVSFLEARMDIKLNNLLGNASDLTPAQMGELIWIICHENILNFLADIPAERKLAVHFEELVRRPEQTVKHLCDFCGVGFETGMLNPYEDPRGRMTDGVHPQSRMVGDMKFHQFKEIDPAVADNWQAKFSVAELSPLTVALARELGYQI